MVHPIIVVVIKVTNIRKMMRMKSIPKTLLLVNQIKVKKAKTKILKIKQQKLTKTKTNRPLNLLKRKSKNKKWLKM